MLKSLFIIVFVIDLGEILRRSDRVDTSESSVMQNFDNRYFKSLEDMNTYLSRAKLCKKGSVC